MKILIYWKSAPNQPEIYDLEQQEFKRLAKDYEQYLRTGSPQTGLYTCMIEKNDVKEQRIKELLINFSDISVIG